MKAWKSPIRILLIFLSVLAFWASFNWSGLNFQFWLSQSEHLILIWGTSWLTYQVLLQIGWAKPTRWEHRLITSLILFLLFDPLVPWWAFLVLGGATEAVQRLIRVPTGPLANPAAVGGLILSAMGQFPSWWGVNFSPRFEIPVLGSMSIAMVLTVPVAIYVANKYKKLPIVAGALVTFSLVYVAFFRSSPLPILIDGTYLFFLLVMALEPKTSPAIAKQQWIYGASLGTLIGVLIGSSLTSYWVEPYLSALVTCNIVFNLYRNRRVWLPKVQQFFPQPVKTNAPVSAVS